jgi:primosomal replication protein N
VSNQLVLIGKLDERKALRYTPAGLPVSEAKVLHASEQFEAGKPRQVVCEVGVLALGDTARWLEAAPLGKEVKLTGFVAARSQHSKGLVLHVQQIEFLEGIENGSLLQKEG